jgi:hypothetical protein
MTYNQKKANEKAKFKAKAEAKAKAKAEDKSKAKTNKIGPDNPNYSSSLELYIEIA